MSVQDYKRKLYKRLQTARRRIERSGEIPAGLARFLAVFLGHASSSCDYEVVWRSQPGLGEECGYSIGRDGTCRTVKRHIALLRKIGAIEIHRMGTARARNWFLVRYEYRLRNYSDKHYQNFYVINWGHPLWREGVIDSEVLTAHRKASRGEIKAGGDSDKRCPNGRWKSAAVTRFEGSESGHACPDRTGSHVTRKKKDKKKHRHDVLSLSLSETPCPPTTLSVIDSVTESSPSLNSQASSGGNLARPRPV